MLLIINTFFASTDKELKTPHELYKIIKGNCSDLYLDFKVLVIKTYVLYYEKLVDWYDEYTREH